MGYTVDLMEEKAMEGFIMRKISVYNQKVFQVKYYGCYTFLLS